MDSGCVYGKSREERLRIIGETLYYWAAFEVCLLRCGGEKVSVREAFLIMQETLVNEVRAQQLDMAARAKFVKTGSQVFETRYHLEPEEPEVEVQPGKPKRRVNERAAKTAQWLEMGVSNKFIEVG